MEVTAQARFCKAIVATGYRKRRTYCYVVLASDQRERGNLTVWVVEHVEAQITGVGADWRKS